MKNDDLRELNDIGARIVWTRESLGLKRSEVVQETGIPMTNYVGRENGIRTHYAEEYKAIAEFFAQKWKEKFQSNFPAYKGVTIKKITTMWLIFGELE
jgi:transcriptional regulator with XRE-family HTH domain